MNTMTATEVNRNFTGATKIVDAEGVIGINKSGKRKYVMMTDERYEDMMKDQLYGKRGEELCKVEIEGEKTRLYQVLMEDENCVAYRICEVPTKCIEIRRTAGSLKVLTDSADRITVSSNRDLLYEDPLDDEDGTVLRQLQEVREIVEHFRALPEKSFCETEYEILVPDYMGEKRNAMSRFGA